MAKSPKLTSKLIANAAAGRVIPKGAVALCIVLAKRLQTAENAVKERKAVVRQRDGLRTKHENLVSRYNTVHTAAANFRACFELNATSVSQMPPGKEVQVRFDELRIALRADK